MEIMADVIVGYDQKACGCFSQVAGRVMHELYREVSLS